MEYFVIEGKPGLQRIFPRVSNSITITAPLPVTKDEPPSIFPPPSNSSTIVTPANSDALFDIDDESVEFLDVDLISESIYKFVETVIPPEGIKLSQLCRKIIKENRSWNEHIEVNGKITRFITKRKEFLFDGEGKMVYLFDHYVAPIKEELSKLSKQPADPKLAMECLKKITPRKGLPVILIKQILRRINQQWQKIGSNMSLLMEHFVVEGEPGLQKIFPRVSNSTPITAPLPETKDESPPIALPITPPTPLPTLSIDPPVPLPVAPSAPSLPATKYESPSIAVPSPAVSIKVESLPTPPQPLPTPTAEAKKTPRLLFKDGKYKTVLLSTPEQLVAAEEHISLAKEVGADCEGVDLSNTGILCLVQIAVSSQFPAFPDDTVYLCDICDTKFLPNLTVFLKKVFENEKITKVMHDCRGDAKGLNSTLKINPKRLMDTQVLFGRNSRLSWMKHCTSGRNDLSLRR